MKVITVSTLKGGVGKSLITFNLAGYLYGQGKRVLVIDLDAQANTTRNMMPLENKNNPTYEKSVIDIFMLKKKEFKEFARPDQLIIKNPMDKYEGFDLIPSSKKLADAEADLQIRLPSGFNLKFKQWLIEFQSELESTYDLIFLDVGPYLAVGTLNALTASDEIFLITDSSANALDGAWTLFDKWSDMCEEMGLINQIKGIMLNNINDTQGSSKDLIEALREMNGRTPIPIFNSYIKNSVKIKDSENDGPVALSSISKIRNNTGVQSLYALAEEIRKEGYL